MSQSTVTAKHMCRFASLQTHQRMCKDGDRRTRSLVRQSSSTPHQPHQHASIDHPCTRLLLRLPSCTCRALLQLLPCKPPTCCSSSQSHICSMDLLLSIYILYLCLYCLIRHTSSCRAHVHIHRTKLPASVFHRLMLQFTGPPCFPQNHVQTQISSWSCVAHQQ